MGCDLHLPVAVGRMDDLEPRKVNTPTKDWGSQSKTVATHGPKCFRVDDEASHRLYYWTSIACSIMFVSQLFLGDMEHVNHCTLSKATRTAAPSPSPAEANAGRGHAQLHISTLQILMPA